MQNPANTLKRCAVLFGITIFAAVMVPLSHAADAEKNKAAMEATDVSGALAALGVQNPGVGKRILLDVPEIVDEKQKISIKVKSAIPNTDWIAVLVDKGAKPFIGQFDLAAKASSIETDVKLMQTSSIIAIVRADGKYYRVDKEVKVAVAGGCD